MKRNRHSVAGFLLPAFLALCPAGCSSTPDGYSGEEQLFHIRPLRPIETLRQEALRAEPPVEAGIRRESDLVELSTLDPTIQFDIRYASERNFLGTPFYALPRAYLQRPAAEALLKAHLAVKKKGIGLLVFDAYRPWYITKMFWEATPEEYREFVADPSEGSRHNRGCAVDLTLYDLETGRPLPMPSDYDEFTLRAHTEYQGGSQEERRNRLILRQVMEEAGFEVFPAEWWHYDFAGWRDYPLLNRPFEELEFSLLP